jgi:hypothetical protein
MYKVPELEKINRIIREAYKRNDIEALEYYLETQIFQAKSDVENIDTNSIKFNQKLE